jgi:hypothetical protein
VFVEIVVDVLVELMKLIEVHAHDVPVIPLSLERHTECGREKYV